MVSEAHPTLSIQPHMPSIAVKPLLKTILVVGSFDRVSVGIVKFSKLSKSNKYTIVFVDYLS